MLKIQEANEESKIYFGFHWGQGRRQGCAQELLSSSQEGCGFVIKALWKRAENRRSKQLSSCSLNSFEAAICHFIFCVVFLPSLNTPLNSFTSDLNVRKTTTFLRESVSCVWEGLRRRRTHPVKLFCLAQLPFELSSTLLCTVIGFALHHSSDTRGGRTCHPFHKLSWHSPWCLSCVTQQKQADPVAQWGCGLWWWTWFQPGPKESPEPRWAYFFSEAPQCHCFWQWESINYGWFFPKWAFSS